MLDPFPTSDMWRVMKLCSEGLFVCLASALPVDISSRWHKAARVSWVKKTPVYFAFLTLHKDVRGGGMCATFLIC